MAHTIDRAACRREAEARFSTAAMARGYEQIYEDQVGIRREEAA